MHCTSRTLLQGVFGPALRRTNSLPPAFLVPSISTSSTSRATFSSTTPSHARKDGNASRGVSALRRTGLGKRQRLRADLADLPVPVRDPKKRSAIEVDPDHGLYGFFNEARDALITPGELAAHGRAWEKSELKEKDWEDLHRLWWVCVKELNCIATTQRERERIGKMYGDNEAEKRRDEVEKTQRRIKDVLTERWYTWEDARVAAMDDPEINLYADPDNGEQAYIPAPEDAIDKEDAANVELAEGALREERSGSLPGRAGLV